MDQRWVKEFPGSIEVCDRQGILLDMNDRAAEREGGRHLLGSNILDCHPEPARAKLEALLAAGRPNVYTIEKKGQKKLIYQAPWFQGGEYQGFVELSLVLPEQLPHYVRKG
ncbi:MAG: diguanylate cyclase [Deltaproteobacteria bacterium RIFOXYA12_FULL_61_11]|nr:MAG: diguanylate cyclase [Deltaproteobacteria bacterium RIFOXYA12_FULL_61_11]